MANFDSEFFGLVFPGFQATEKIHAQNSRPELSAFLSNFTFLNPKFIHGDFLLTGEAKISLQNFPGVFGLCFPGSGDQKKFTKIPALFQCQIPRQIRKPYSHKLSGEQAKQLTVLGFLGALCSIQPASDGGSPFCDPY